MARRVFQSFHYLRDSHRVAQIEKMGAVRGQPILSANGWEKVKLGGDAAIRRWIRKEMAGKSCLVVLIGSRTSQRSWVRYEIKKAWDDGLGVVGVHIHKLKDLGGEQSPKGANPLYQVRVGPDQQRLSTIAKTYDPPYVGSKRVYRDIEESLPGWVEEAITIRRKY